MTAAGILMIACLIFVVVFLVCSFAHYAWKDRERKQRLSTYVFLKNGNRYTAKKLVKTKIPETGEWVDMVLYESQDNNALYCREQEDFQKKFKSIRELALDPTLKEHQHYIKRELNSKRRYFVSPNAPIVRK